jgi:hypothetical protein
MKKKIRTISAFLLIMALILASSPAVAGLEEETMLVEGKRVYLVKPGDSLSKIAARIYGDYTRWKEILDKNPQINDAALIFPGDTLVISEEATADAGLGVREAKPKPVVKARVEPPPPPDPVIEPVPVYEPVVFKIPTSVSRKVQAACGRISREVPEATIIGSPETRISLSPFDAVFIDRGDKDGLTVGQEFRVVRPTKEIFHPDTLESLGWLIRVVGLIKIDCLQEETATATIVSSIDVVKIGDRVEPYDPTDMPAEVFISPKLKGPCLPPEAGNGGVILAQEIDKTLISDGDLVYIDRGSASGINTGSKMAVYRLASPELGQSPYLIGELQVLDSGEETSCAMVTNCIQPIKVADSLIFW